MQFDLRKFIATGTQPYHAEFPCDLSARDFAGARIEQPVTASFTAEPDGDEVRMTLRAKALVHGECARCLEFLFQIPTVLLCSPDCPGLCPRCGKKMAECTCPPAEDEAAPADARLAILKSLLN